MCFLEARVSQIFLSRFFHFSVIVYSENCYLLLVSFQSRLSCEKLLVIAKIRFIIYEKRILQFHCILMRQVRSSIPKKMPLNSWQYQIFSQRKVIIVFNDNFDDLTCPRLLFEFSSKKQMLHLTKKTKISKIFRACKNLKTFHLIHNWFKKNEILILSKR